MNSSRANIAVQTGTENIVRFVQFVEGGRLPRRADRSVGGTLPVRALRYCEPVSSASAFGWYVFLPQRFQLLWDGNRVSWRSVEMEEFEPLRSVHYPRFADTFDAAAPEAVRGYAPPFLTASIQPGAVQIWPGSMARTAPGLSLLVRPVANLARSGGYEHYEGIIETDDWLGPLFTNVRLTRTGAPIDFDDEVPFMQVQPVGKGTYDERWLDRYTVASNISGLTADDWHCYARSIVEPNSDPDRRLGTYAARVRKAGAARRADAGE